MRDMISHLEFAYTS